MIIILVWKRQNVLKHTDTEAWHKIYNKIVERAILKLFVKEQRIEIGPNKYIVKQFISQQKIENYLLRYATIPKQILMKNRILINLLMQMLSYDPSQRIDSASALRHEWFRDVNVIPPSINRYNRDSKNRNSKIRDSKNRNSKIRDSKSHRKKNKNI